MWVCVVTLIFAGGTFAMFTTHEQRELIHALSAAAFALAFVVTLVQNKIKFGAYFPGPKK
jgi:hypothetical protein